MNADGYHIIESVMLNLLQLNNYMSNHSFKKNNNRPNLCNCKSKTIISITNHLKKKVLLYWRVNILRESIHV